MDAAEDDVRVGHCRRGAFAVTGRAGIRAGAFGTDTQQAAGVDACEGSAARADGMNIEHGDADGQTVDDGFGGMARFAIDQTDIGGGAAHVESENAADAAGAGSGDSADHAAGGSGEYCTDGVAGGVPRGEEAAAGLHDGDAEAPGAE